MGFFKKLDELADVNSSRFHAIESHKMLIAWVASVAVIVSLGFFFHGQKIVFSGIAEATETTVSMPEAVEVVKIHVIPGKEVHAGDTLVELSRPDLALRMFGYLIDDIPFDKRVYIKVFSVSVFLIREILCEKRIFSFLHI